MDNNISVSDLAPYFYSQITKLIADEEEDWLSKFAPIFTNFIVLTTDKSGLVFNSLFARMSYLAYNENIRGDLSFCMHKARKQFESNNAKPYFTQKNSYAILSVLIEKIWKEPIPSDLTFIKDYLPVKQYSRDSSFLKFYPYVRLHLLEKNEEKGLWKAVWEENPDQYFFLNYKISDEKEHLQSTVRLIEAKYSLPLTISVIDVELRDENVFDGNAIILEPDFLIDVTTIAQSFHSKGAFPHLQILNKWLPMLSSPSLLLGNLANFTLDHLIGKSDLTFKELLPLYFRNFALDFAFMNDAELRKLLLDLQVHFTSLKTMVDSGFAKFGIDISDCFLEPTFYSSRYGIQGRLDILYQNPHAVNDLCIVELKSGSPYMANKYGIGHSHYIQTLLYDLLIRSAFGENKRPVSYILYSKMLLDQLKYAPAVRSQQYEALEVRNQIVVQEKQLSEVYSVEDMEQFLEPLRAENNPSVDGFLASDLRHFFEIWNGMDTVERAYFSAFMGFTAREHLLSKSGIQNNERSNGQSSLWLESLQEKESKFSTLSFLRVVENRSNEVDPIIVMQRSAQTNAMANLRVGDIGILYPYDGEDQTILNAQLFKCSIIQMDDKTVTVRLRAAVFSKKLFEGISYWNIESDHMDSSFNAQYRSFVYLFKSDLIKRRKVLGILPPDQPTNKVIDLPKVLSEEQRGIISGIINSSDYYLLWGPPGTGKTSFILKYLVQWLMENTQERIMLMALTNRAVDEICDAILEISPSVSKELIRIGSRFSVGENSREYLLQSQMEEVDNREGLQRILKQKRIWTGTVASVNGKREILERLKFDRVIIDEASQLLEPMVVGLLPLFDHFTMIGDHRQLPAVVVQPEKTCMVKEKVLNDIHLNILSSSLFERLIDRSKDLNCRGNMGKLSFQGRMVPGIMEFPSTHFYNGRLKALESVKVQNHWELTESDDQKDIEFRRTVLELPSLFLPHSFIQPANVKTNKVEAELTVELIKKLIAWYADMGKEWTVKSLGVITPYRSQIACINKEIHDAGLDANLFSVDTVERYQGGARDIIIISLCLNSKQQLQNLVSLSSDDVDRKLNVALTRARKQLFIIGNPLLMKESKYYKALMDALPHLLLEEKTVLL